MSSAEPSPAGPTYDPSADLGPSLDEVAVATDRLLATVDRLTDDDVRAPSGLPGWTRAHVLTHLARNADALGNLAWWARTGEERDMYPGGPSAREEAIEAGAGRRQGDLRLDLNESAERLLEQFADFPAEGLAREVRSGRGGTWLGWELPLMRLREVEIHHVDLGLPGFTFDDWPVEYVREELRRQVMVAASRSPMGVGGTRGLPEGALAMPEARRLAWLIGRLVVPDLPTPPPFP